MFGVSSYYLLCIFVTIVTIVVVITVVVHPGAQFSLVQAALCKLCNVHKVLQQCCSVAVIRWVR